MYLRLEGSYSEIVLSIHNLDYIVEFASIQSTAGSCIAGVNKQEHPIRACIETRRHHTTDLRPPRMLKPPGGEERTHKGKEEEREASINVDNEEVKEKTVQRCLS